MRLDPRVVTRGALYALCWIVPAAIANALAHAHKAGGLTALTFLLIVLGFVFAGFAVARLGAERPLQHAAAASVLAFALVQGVLDIYEAWRHAWLAVDTDAMKRLFDADHPGFTYQSEEAASALHPLSARAASPAHAASGSVRRA